MLYFSEQTDKSELGEVRMEIKVFDESYRDDMIIMVMQAKEALGENHRSTRTC